jgi:hypothetical protein
VEQFLGLQFNRHLEFRTVIGGATVFTAQLLPATPRRGTKRGAPRDRRTWSSGAAVPAGAPPSMLMLQIAVRPSTARMASPIFPMIARLNVFLE